MATENGPASEASKEFMKKINEAVLGSCVTMGLALGSELGLFKVMCQFDSWASAQEIADATNCKERYIREWLYHMTSGGVIEINKDSETFLLPHSHREALTASIADGSLVRVSRHVLGLASAFPQLTSAFKQDGPLGIDFTVSRIVLDYWEKDRDMETMLSEILLQLPEEMKAKLEQGAACCDVGGGRGNMVLTIAPKFPNSHFTNCDFSPQSLEEGREAATRRGITNVTFLQQNIMELPEEWHNKFDFLLMVDVLHDLPDPVKAAKGLYTMLKPGGYLSLVDIKADSDPHLTTQNKGNSVPAQVLYTLSLYHCMSACLNYPGSLGLGTCAGFQRFTQILNEGGFSEIERGDLATDHHFLCRKPLP